MTIQPEFSAELFQELFLNEELYLIQKDVIKEVENANVQLSESNNKEAKKVAEQPVIQVVTNHKETISESQKLEITNDLPSTETIQTFEKKAIPLLILANKITEADKVFLEKVLNAVKLSLESVEIFTVENLKTTDFRSFAADKSFSRIISFGMPFSKIGISKMFVPYQITIIKNIYFLMAEDLSVVENDIAHKRMFWACLQQIFS